MNKMIQEMNNNLGISGSLCRKLKLATHLRQNWRQRAFPANQPKVWAENGRQSRLSIMC
jgi:hypothetical protein